MTIGEIAACLMAIAAIAGVFYTIRRNGTKEDQKAGSLKQSVVDLQNNFSSGLDGVKESLNDKDHGLIALNDKISDFKTHCASVSTELATKVDIHDRDIQELKSRHRKKKAS